VDHCQECGFVYADVSARDLPVRLRAAGPRFGAALEAVPDPRRRPAPAVWSPLEYTCHVRDVLRVQGERVALALHADHPTFVAMGRDERVVQDGYNSQDLSTVVADLHDAANDLAGVFAGLTASQWSRTGVYNWPAAESRSLLWIGRHTIHELEHHLIDVGRR
jgi:S-DNA-T family DNA segregation ATPase FtsK/SpoIIIE